MYLSHSTNHLQFLSLLSRTQTELSHLEWLKEKERNREREKRINCKLLHVLSVCVWILERIGRESNCYQLTSSCRWMRWKCDSLCWNDSRQFRGAISHRPRRREDGLLREELVNISLRLSMVFRAVGLSREKRIHMYLHVEKCRDIMYKCKIYSYHYTAASNIKKYAVHTYVHLSWLVLLGQYQCQLVSVQPYTIYIRHRNKELACLFFNVLPVLQSDQWTI